MCWATRGNSLESSRGRESSSVLSSTRAWQRTSCATMGWVSTWLMLTSYSVFFNDFTILTNSKVRESVSRQWHASCGAMGDGCGPRERWDEAPLSTSRCEIVPILRSHRPARIASLALLRYTTSKKSAEIEELKAGCARQRLCCANLLGLLG